MLDPEALAAARARRRSSVSSIALPVVDSGGLSLASSVTIQDDKVEFEAHGVKVDYHGLYIDGEDVSEVHQEDLVLQKVLGRGACSVVKKAQHVETRDLYAVKVFSIFDKEKRAMLLKEIQTLASMDSPSLVQFLGAYLKEGSIHVVLEYMDKGDLNELIHEWDYMHYDEEVMAAITYQVLWGLGYLHHERRLHRDIKPQNVLISSDGHVKLSDFGIARELEGEMDMAQTMVGTIRYMSPERLAGTGYGPPADVWSVGVLLLELANRKLPFMGSVTQIDLHDQLQETGLEQIIAQCADKSPEFQDVLRGCFRPNPKDRLTPMELLELDWFEKLGVHELDHAVEVMHNWLHSNDGFGDEEAAAPRQSGIGLTGAARGGSAGGGPVAMSGTFNSTGRSAMIQTMHSDGSSSEEGEGGEEKGMGRFDGFEDVDEDDDDRPDRDDDLLFMNQEGKSSRK